jgi:hypothetical protein
MKPVKDIIMPVQQTQERQKEYGVSLYSIEEIRQKREKEILLQVKIALPFELQMRNVTVG